MEGYREIAKYSKTAEIGEIARETVNVVLIFLVFKGNLKKLMNIS